MSADEGPAPDHHPDRSRGAVRRGAAWLLSGQLLGLVAGLAQSIVVVGVLGPAGQGQYAIALLLLGLATLIAGQATIVGTIHYTANGELGRDRIAAACGAVVAVGSFGCWCALALGSVTGTTAVLLPGVSGAAIIATAAAVPLLLVRQFASALLTGSELFADAALVDVIQSVGAAVLIAGTLLFFPTVEGMFAAFLTASFAAATVGVTLVARLDIRLFGRPSRAVIAQILRFGTRAAVGSTFQFLTYRLDFAIVNLLTSTHMLGIYSVASRFAELLWVLPGAVGGAVFAVRSRDASPGTAAQTARAFWGSGAVTLVGGAALALGAPVALPLLYGEEMTSAVLPLLVLLPGTLLLGTSAILANDVAARGRPGLISIIAIAGATLTVILDVALIPPFGIVGAAAASTLAYGSYAFMAIGAYLRVSGTRPGDFARAAGDLPPILDLSR